MVESDSREIAIEVVYARPGKQQQVRLQVVPGTTARMAVTMSALQRQFAEIDSQHCAIGVFGRQVDDAFVLRAGDRVEIYRPLLLDPRTARRQRATSRKPGRPESG